MRKQPIIEVTLKEVYDKNNADHEEILKCLGSLKGRTKLNFWIASTAITLTILVFTMLVNHIN